jgi:hypothetical protein
MTIRSSNRRQQRSNFHVPTTRSIGNGIRIATFILAVSSSVGVEAWSVSRLATRRPPTNPSSSSPLVRKRVIVQSLLRRMNPFQSTLRDNDLSEVNSKVLVAENKLLREVIGELEEENLRLKQRGGRIVLENFEGERRFRDKVPGLAEEGLTLTGDEILQDELWCDELDGGKNYQDET